MKGITLGLVCAFLLTNVYCDVRTDGIIRRVNSLGATWRAGVNTRFDKASDEFIMSQMGTFLDASRGVEGTKWPEVELGALPDSYDVRDKYSSCKSVSEIRDQGSCGSCWAVAAVEAISDRICIKQSKDIHISAVDLLSCCNKCGYGCQGGYPIEAWRYWYKTGIVTGGSYNSFRGCRPYPIAKCSHHVEGQYPACGDIVSTPECVTECREGYTTDYSDDKHKGSKYYYVPKNVSSIMSEIYQRGPVEAAFKVYTDFLTYKSGVYQYSEGEFKGGHAVKILGWGSQNGVDYWLAANSWNSDWGEEGYFKILRGDNECGIEENMVAGIAPEY
ncbi:Cathepsin B [Oopsacas minuta]|uniref:Cathepsin B n=1 Tax=Oopsacas minuta TaxID=111878 RepID=A0AAV7JIW8_9METZ|nr:Cathepsin B [Oopsacas minuta]